jgi:phage tail-like protein
MTADASIAYGLSLRFVVEIDGKSLGNWSKVDGLDVTWELAEFRAGDAKNYRWYFPAATKYSNVTLTRGVSTKETAKVLEWLGSISFEAKKDMTAKIEMHDASNTAVAKWVLEGVVPVHYTGPKFDAGSSQVGTETLVLAHLGFLDPMSGKAIE